MKRQNPARSGRCRPVRGSAWTSAPRRGPTSSPTVARYTLEIAEVRVQRLDEIDDRDADAEGVETMDGILDEADICRLAKSFPACGYEDGRAWYAATWEHIHGIGSWERDRGSWVFATTFRKVER